MNGLELNEILTLLNALVASQRFMCELVIVHPLRAGIP